MRKCFCKKVNDEHFGEVRAYSAACCSINDDCFCEQCPDYHGANEASVEAELRDLFYKYMNCVLLSEGVDFMNCTTWTDREKELINSIMMEDWA